MAENSRLYDDIWRQVFRDRKTTKRIHWERMRDLVCAASKDVVGSVLDLGCGFGFLSEFVKGRYLGVDFSPFVIGAAKKLYPKSEFLVADIQNLQLSDMFDTVAMLEVLEHLDDREQVVETIRHLARKRIVVSVPRGRSRSGNHIWNDISREDIVALLGPGTECRRYRRKWIAAWRIE